MDWMYGINLRSILKWTAIYLQFDRMLNSFFPTQVPRMSFFRKIKSNRTAVEQLESMSRAFLTIFTNWYVIFASKYDISIDWSHWTFQFEIWIILRLIILFCTRYRSISKHFERLANRKVSKSRRRHFSIKFQKLHLSIKREKQRFELEWLTKLYAMLNWIHALMALQHAMRIHFVFQMHQMTVIW